MGRWTTLANGRSFFVDNDLPLDEFNPCASEVREAGSYKTDEQLADENAAAEQGWQEFYGKPYPNQ